MAVATKRRRKITVLGLPYVWYVAEDKEGAGLVLHVLSSDKQFIVQYQIDQPMDEDYVVVQGPRFAGASTGGVWKRFLCPPFVAQTVTPQSVRELIEWCLDENLERKEIDWRSHTLRL